MVLLPTPRVEIIGVEGIPIVKKEDNLPQLILDALEKQGIELLDGDILVVCQSVVSRAEGRVRKLADVKPSVAAEALAEQINKDPRLVELVLSEAKYVLRATKEALITRTRLGWICANSGVDLSNVDGGESASLLPIDPDKSARVIRDYVAEKTGKRVAVVITDTFGRPHREGQVNVAIGVAGMKPIWDRRGEKDLFGYTLRVKQIAVADEIAAAAELVMGNSSEGIPVAIVRGYRYIPDDEASSSTLKRPLKRELFI